MNVDPTVTQRLVRWAESRDDLRALLLFSSRVDPGAEVDALSDYDVFCIVEDVRAYHTDDRWLSDVGSVLVVYRNPIAKEHGFDSFGFITHYQDGTKIDFCVFPCGYLRWIATCDRLPDDLDRGYVVLIDKDSLTPGLPAPTWSAYRPKPPTQAEYRLVVEEFFNDAAYVAKNLWRDDLLAAKLSLDHIMKYQCLRRMLEWHTYLRLGWNARLGKGGRHLSVLADRGLWVRLMGTYVGGAMEDNWRALLETVDLFKEIATEVALGLGLRYPQDLHDKMCDHLSRVRSLDRCAPTDRGSSS